MRKIKERLSDFVVSKDNKIDLEQYGDYRLGLTDKEIKDYLCIRAHLQKYINKNVDELYKLFCKIAGVNTLSIGPNGQTLMYRWDVERFASVLFDNKPTYWD